MLDDLKKAQLRTPIGNVTTYDELKSTFQESNTEISLPNISDAAIGAKFSSSQLLQMFTYT